MKIQIVSDLLVDRGPRSADARASLETRRITLSVPGNHVQILHDRIRSAERAGNTPSTWGMHPWFPRDVPRAPWMRWRSAIAAMPIAATIETKHGDVGLTHASPAARHRWESLRKLEAGEADTMTAALWSSARAHELHMAPRGRACPSTGPSKGCGQCSQGTPLSRNPEQARTCGTSTPAPAPGPFGACALVASRVHDPAREVQGTRHRSTRAGRTRSWVSSGSSGKSVSGSPGTRRIACSAAVRGASDGSSTQSARIRASTTCASASAAARAARRRPRAPRRPATW